MLSFRNGDFKFLVEFFEINDKFFCTGRCKISFGMNGKVRVITLVGKEGRDTSGRARCIVIGKFYKSVWLVHSV